ncbi:hypothetical protein, partial [Plesiomonas shigelloides]|uniref:hypothetical protein n=1 Tax=Plesiomonas shigelloides TaxID=703 RepID=UPI001C4996BF
YDYGAAGAQSVPRWAFWGVDGINLCLKHCERLREHTGRLVVRWLSQYGFSAPIFCAQNGGREQAKTRINRAFEVGDSFCNRIELMHHAAVSVIF